MKDAPDVATLCRELDVALVARTHPHTTPMDGFLIMLRSANNEQASSILRKKFEAHFAQPLAALLPGPESAQRAAMLLAVIAGIQLMRQIVELAALTQAKPDELAGRIETVFGLLVKDVPRGNPQTRKSP
ncbi:hypothetical protein PQQ86_32720 [Paraburkholderia sediminicola]|uniref:TetR/AcrR family transcriptional regulator n=1 Tax=Paraburkholderia sediminicola TaxID=458836 RepID=UPI0038BDA014